MKSMTKKRMPFILLAAGGLLATGTIVAAQNVELQMLSGLSKGEWTLKYRDGSPSSKICVRSGQELIQVRHNQRGCNRYIVTDTASEVEVQYSCRGDGYGNTRVRRETSDLIQIESSGIADGKNFRLFAEARRTGSC